MKVEIEWLRYWHVSRQKEKLRYKLIIESQIWMTAQLTRESAKQQKEVHKCCPCCPCCQWCPVHYTAIENNKSLKKSLKVIALPLLICGQNRIKNWLVQNRKYLNKLLKKPANMIKNILLFSSPQIIKCGKNGHLWPYGHYTMYNKYRQVGYPWKDLSKFSSAVLTRTL